MTERSAFVNKIVAAAFIVILFVLGFWLIGFAIKFFLLIFAAILLAVLLRAGTNFFKDKLKVPDGVGVGISLFLFLGILAGVIILIIPTVVEQSEDIREQAPQALEQLKSDIQQTTLGRALFDRMPDDPQELLPEDEELMNIARRFATTTLGIVTDILIILIIGIFFAVSPQLYVQGVVILVAPRYRPRVEDVMHQVYHALKSWLLGKFIAMLFIGVAAAIGLMLFGVPAAFALGFLAFLADFIPNIGPLVAAVPAILLAFLDGPMTALYVAIFYLVIQQIESYVLVPYIYKKTVAISPVITLASLILLGILAGGLGVIMATPLVAAFQVMIRELYVKDYLEKDLDDSSENSFESRMQDV
ncbi:MAG TPA: AI-2E family transporter [Anditalea sp.]|nr:AI-2E family transporter [Anditalea sp.]